MLLESPQRVRFMIKNKDFALVLIQDKRQVLEHVSAALQNDKDIVLAALENTPNAMEFISSALEEDGDIIAMYEVSLSILAPFNVDASENLLNK